MKLETFEQAKEYISNLSEIDAFKLGILTGNLNETAVNIFLEDFCSSNMDIDGFEAMIQMKIDQEPSNSKAPLNIKRAYIECMKAILTVIRDDMGIPYELYTKMPFICTPYMLNHPSNTENHYYKAVIHIIELYELYQKYKETPEGKITELAHFGLFDSSAN